jgi:hypothetical protein
MPYDIKQDGKGDKPTCVYLKETGEKLGCTSNEYMANRMIAAIEANKHAAKAWLTVDEVRVLCVPCADKMQSMGITRVNPFAIAEQLGSAAKAGDVANLAKHLVKTYGSDPHFWEKCDSAEELASYDDEARAAICARAHFEATGQWPGEHAGKAEESEVSAVLDRGQQSAGHTDGVLAVKAVASADGELTLDVLGVPHGQDRQGQVFDERTHLGDLPAVPVYYHHGFDEMRKPIVELIGWAVKTVRDGAGQWFRATLNKAKSISQTIYNDAVKGKVTASSDAVSHLVRPVGIVGRPGRVSSWPVAGLSLMDASTAGTAINPRAIAMPAVRAMFEQALSDLGSESDDPGDSSPSTALTAATAAKAGAKYSRLTRERMREMRTALGDAMQAIDGMMSEFPVEEQMNSEDAATIAAVTGDQATQPLAAKADVLALTPDQLKVLVTLKVEEALKARGLLQRAAGGD